jgi:DNA-binding transcriptional regulator YdaS (Cro superfamily)
MDLKTYLKTLTTDEREAFAKRCDTSVGHLNNISYGLRPCAEQLAIEIEKNSERKVTCEILCPETDWAYIRGTAAGKSKSTRTAA